MTSSTPKDQAASPRPNATIGFLARILIGIVLVVAGTMKVSAPAEEFEVVIDAYNILPSDMTLTMATFLPWLEILVGYALILGYFTRPASIIAGSFFSCFILALASARLRGIELPNCGCFGAGFHASPGAAIGMDLFMVALTIYSYKSGKELLSLDHWATGRQP